MIGKKIAEERVNLFSTLNISLIVQYNHTLWVRRIKPNLFGFVDKEKTEFTTKRNSDETKQSPK